MFPPQLYTLIRGFLSDWLVTVGVDSHNSNFHSNADGTSAERVYRNHVHPGIGGKVILPSLHPISNHSNPIKKLPLIFTVTFMVRQHLGFGPRGFVLHKTHMGQAFPLHKQTHIPFQLCFLSVFSCINTIKSPKQMFRLCFLMPFFFRIMFKKAVLNQLLRF